MALDQSDKVTLELLVDKSTMQDVLEALADIANEKAAHVAEVWQDTPLSKAWEGVAKKIEQAAQKVDL